MVDSTFDIFLNNSGLLIGKIAAYISGASYYLSLNALIYYFKLYRAWFSYPGTVALPGDISSTSVFSAMG